MDEDFTLLPPDFEDAFISDYAILLRSPFRLFDLPPELWLRICAMAVIQAKPLQIGKEAYLRDSMAIVKQPAITRTCRLIRDETLPIFYSSNTFEMFHGYDVPCPRKFIVAIGDANRRRMKTLLMHSNCQKDFWDGSFCRAGIGCEIDFVRRDQIPRLILASSNTFRIRFT